MSRRLLLLLTALVAGALVLAELLLRPPNAEERLHLGVILAVPAIIAAALVPLLGRWVSGRASVAGAALVVGLCSLALGAVTTSAASNAMFLSSHDYRLFLVVLVLSCGIALVVGSQLTRPLAHDIARLGEVAEQVAGGDLSVRSGIDRRDEVGRTARAIDQMVEALDAAEHERVRSASARQTLFTSIGHDLRTPLAAMRAAVESLQDGVAPDPDRYYDILDGQLDDIEALLDQLVEYARIESGQRAATREVVALAELAHEAIEALSPVAHRLDVHLELRSDGPAYVLASTVEISRVLRNLLENAIRHSPPTGKVCITIRAAADSDAGRHALSDEGVELRFCDEGEGFPPDFREQAFEPFTRADPARGTRTGHAGLGLAITRALVESHGGRVWIGDQPGGDVRVWLPTKEHV